MWQAAKSDVAVGVKHGASSMTDRSASDRKEETCPACTWLIMTSGRQQTVTYKMQVPGDTGYRHELKEPHPRDVCLPNPGPVL